MHQALYPGAGGREQLGELGYNLDHRFAESFCFRAADQPFGRSIEDTDATVRIDADNAGACASQHRLGEPSPTVDQITSTNDIVALRAKLLRHFVECLAELRKVTFVLDDDQVLDAKAAATAVLARE